MYQRPTGVTILAILEIIGGVFSLLGGMGNIIAAVSVTAIPIIGAALGPLLITIGIVLILLGVLAFIVAYGLLKGRGWAWTLALILAIIGIIQGVIGLMMAGGFVAIIGIIINAVVIYYLTRPHVKQFFGKT